MAAGAGAGHFAANHDHVPCASIVIARLRSRKKARQAPLILGPPVQSRDHASGNSDIGDHGPPHIGRRVAAKARLLRKTCVIRAGAAARPRTRRCALHALARRGDTAYCGCQVLDASRSRPRTGRSSPAPRSRRWPLRAFERLRWSARPPRPRAGGQRHRLQAFRCTESAPAPAHLPRPGAALRQSVAALLPGPHHQGGRGGSTAVPPALRPRTRASIARGPICRPRRRRVCARHFGRRQQSRLAFRLAEPWLSSGRLDLHFFFCALYPLALDLPQPSGGKSSMRSLASLSPAMAAPFPRRGVRTAAAAAAYITPRSAAATIWLCLEQLGAVSGSYLSRHWRPLDLDPSPQKPKSTRRHGTASLRAGARRRSRSPRTARFFDRRPRRTDPDASRRAPSSRSWGIAPISYGRAVSASCRVPSSNTIQRASGRARAILTILLENRGPGRNRPRPRPGPGADLRPSTPPSPDGTLASRRFTA